MASSQGLLTFRAVVTQFSGEMVMPVPSFVRIVQAHDVREVQEPSFLGLAVSNARSDYLFGAKERAGM